MKSHIINLSILLVSYLFTICLSGFIWFIFTNDKYNLMTLSYFVALIVTFSLCFLSIYKLTKSFRESIGELLFYAIFLIWLFFVGQIITHFTYANKIFENVKPYSLFYFRETNKYDIVDGPIYYNNRGPDSDQKIVFQDNTNQTNLFYSNSKKLFEIEKSIRNHNEFVNRYGYFFWQTAKLEDVNIDEEIKKSINLFDYLFGGFLIILEDCILNYFFFLIMILLFIYYVKRIK
jgi:hypothetical protein